MKKINLSKQDTKVVKNALDHWQEIGLLDSDKVQVLNDNMDVRSFEWKVLAKYAFWVALGSLILSVFSLFADDALERFIEKFYDTPNIVFCIAFAVLSILFYTFGFRNKKKYPDNTFSNETIMLAGAFSTAACVGFLGQILNRDTHQYSILFFLSIVVYGILSVKLNSKLLWVFMLIAAGVWFATETAYHSDWGWKFWGMNYPARFTIFGFVVTLLAVYVLPRIKFLGNFRFTSIIIGLLYTMIALWLLSIFGNYSSLEVWYSIRQYKIFYWGLFAILLSLSLAIYGMKIKDNVIRDIGFVFFLLNLYTRFVEYLWDNINRTIFFLLLAISFWLVGRWAERIWKKKST